MKKFVFALFLIVFSCSIARSNNKITVNRVDPSNWFVGLKNTHLQLLVHGKNWQNPTVTCTYPGVKIIKSMVQANANYLVVDMELSDELKSGVAQLVFSENGKKYTYKYLFKEPSTSVQPMGLSPADNIYLIMPDRFANGNQKNDIIPQMTQFTVDRAQDFERHGGDLQGIIDHIPYLDSLGVTALWLNPVFENNQPHESYHGYAITDHYAIDPRLGTSKKYQELIDKLHGRKMKIIKDVVFNHFGNNHYLIKDLPDSNWINQWDTYTKSNFRAPTVFDPYAAPSDKKQFQNGWFDHHMPDINQQNPIVANYLIQNSIWWIATYGIDAYRIDTYAYSDQKFMSRWAKAIITEFPDFFLFGETWVHGEVVQSYFVDQSSTPRPYPSYMNSVTDFQLCYALNHAITQPFGWTQGVADVYYTLAQDLIYSDPQNLVTFVDNHDLARFYGTAGKDLNKFKMGYGMLFTLRGIPQVLYGSEILLSGTENHGKIREDFWGGWKSDTVNKFTHTGRTDRENEAFDFMQNLLNWRKTCLAVTEGNLIQFIPENGLYTYVRTYRDQTVLVVVNATEEAQKISLKRYANYLPPAHKKVLEVIEMRPYVLIDSLDMAPYGIHIFEYNR